MNGNVNESGRLVWADLIRVVAILGVIMIHVSAPVFYAKDSVPLDFFLTGTFFDAFSRVSVPLFVMLSGALLLKGEEKPFVANRVVKQVLKVLLPLAFWSVMAGFWIDYSTRQSLAPLTHLMRMFKEPVMYHLGFCYYILGVYLLLPLIDVLAVKLVKSWKFAAYFFGIWFIANCFRLHFQWPLLDLLQISGVLSWSGYFLLGFYVSQSAKILRLPSGLALSLYILGSIGSFFVTWYISDLAGKPNEAVFNYLSPITVISSVGLFIFLRKIKTPRLLDKPLESIAEITFMIYFMHIFIIEFLKGGYFRFHISSFSIHPLFGILGSAFLTFVISILFAKVARKIPKSSKILG